MVEEGNYQFGLYAPEEGRVKENDNFYNELQKILNKINKNYKMLLSGDLNAFIGNCEIYNIARRFGEQVINTNRLKLRNFATNNNMKIINSFYKQKIYVYIYIYIYIYIWIPRNFKTVTDFFFFLTFC